MKLLCCEPCPWHGFADIEWNAALDRYNFFQKQIGKAVLRFTEFQEIEHDQACCRCKINAKMSRH